MLSTKRRNKDSVLNSGYETALAMSKAHIYSGLYVDVTIIIITAMTVNGYSPFKTQKEIYFGVTSILAATAL